jgi:protease IV
LMRDKITPDLFSIYFDQLNKMKDLAGVVFEINSPGGSAAASEEILAQINEFKKNKHVPVVFYVCEMAGSGGYYIAQSGDRIIANPNAIIGSIGVISVFPQAHKLLKNKLDLDFVTVKSGKFKDFGSFLRDMTKEEVDYWQSLVMMYYDHFVDVVASGRHLDKAAVKMLADGRLFHPDYAKNKKLVDGVGTMTAAIEAAHILGNIKESTRWLHLTMTIDAANNLAVNVQSPMTLPQLQDAFGSLPIVRNGGVWYLTTF